MYKKIALATIIAFGSNFAFAKHVDYKNERDSYVPVAVPVQAEVISYTSTVVPYVGLGLGVKNYRSYDGLIGNVFTGLGKRVGYNNNYYVGGEIFADVGSIPLSGLSYGRRATYGLGASFIPGVMLNNYTMAYGRIGVRTSHYQGTNNYNTGPQLGLGLQTAVYKNWDVRGEYVYTGSGLTGSRFKKGTNQVNIGLVYKF